MNVTYQLQEIFVLGANDRFVAPLKNVAHFAMTHVEILAVGLLESLHELGQGLIGAL
jgi:hypothetical protein